MINEEIIARTADGRPLYDNTPTVVAVVAMDVKGRLLAIRRANQPGKGLIGLPGGYHMRGESWQQAGCREVLQETGVTVHPSDLVIWSMNTDEYGNNLVISHVPIWVDHEPLDFVPDPAEVSEVMWLDNVGSPDEWAFPRHYEAAFNGMRATHLSFLPRRI